MVKVLGWTSSDTSTVLVWTRQDRIWNPAAMMLARLLLPLLNTDVTRVVWTRECPGTHWNLDGCAPFERPETQDQRFPKGEVAEFVLEGRDVSGDDHSCRGSKDECYENDNVSVEVLSAVLAAGHS
jgi:hypothetical protein